ncbi:DDB1- and CUL4-associated factor 11-like isoform X2 [Corticium candelabrum]|nr:DDB1- and CUL4-associated factor 11-like isoform X2 [Corticium candelabrum]
MSNYLPNTKKTIESFPSRLFGGFFSDDGSVFMSSCQDQHIRLFDVTNGRFKCFKDILAKDIGWTIVDTTYSPDQNYLVYSSWSDCIHMCNVHGDYETHIPLDLRPPGSTHFCAFCVRFSKDNKEILAGGNDGCLYVYDRERAERTLIIHGHSDDCNAVAFADNSSQLLFSGGDDALCKVWDRRVLGEKNPRPVGTLVGHGAGVTFIDTKGDGHYFISNSKDQSIKLWDVRSFSSKDAIACAKQMVDRHCFDYRWEEPPRKFLKDWKLAGDTSVMTYKGHRVQRCQIRCRFSPAHSTGQQYIYSGCSEGRLFVYDVLTGRVIGRYSEHDDAVRDVSWHPFQPVICTSSWDGKIGWWEYTRPHEIEPRECRRPGLRPKSSLRMK